MITWFICVVTCHSGIHEEVKRPRSRKIIEQEEEEEEEKSDEGTTYSYDTSMMKDICIYIYHSMFNMGHLN